MVYPANADKDSGRTSMIRVSSNVSTAANSEISIDGEKAAPPHRISSFRSEDKEMPPSEHLWVGNVASTMTEEELAEQFSRFGEIEKLDFFPLRNYAFVRFRTVEDAIYAKRGLQGETFRGRSLRIKFANGGGKSAPYQEPDSKIVLKEQGTSSLQREASRSSKVQTEKLKGNKDGDPSEVLWIGFPVHMNVDDRKLQRVFAPYGGIERITTFSGRPYAFVQFESVEAASRAKDALQGKLFDDPRVSVSFAKSEVGPVDHSRGTSTFLSPSPVKIGMEQGVQASKSGRAGDIHNDRALDHNHFKSEILSSRSEVRLHGGISSNIDSMELAASITSKEIGGRKRAGTEYGSKPEMDLVEDPAASSSPFLQSHYLHSEDKWKSHEEVLQKGALKKVRIDEGNSSNDVLGSTSIEKFEVDRPHIHIPKSHDQFSMGMQVDLHGEFKKPSASLEGWKNHDGPKSILDQTDVNVNLPNTSKVLSRVSDHQPKDLFRWEGTIAKGGSVICHARCLPARQGVNVSFPEVVDCTARTSLDMLASHVTQVGDFAVVLFMPQGEMDVAPYQEFMGFLSDKQRAAVCKISEDSTLFLVPPSDFVEQYLKVPKSRNLFGVVIKLQLPHQNLGDQMGFFKPLRTQASILFDASGEESCQKPALNSSSKHLSEPVFGNVPSSAVISTSKVDPPHLHLQQHGTAQPSISGITSLSPAIGGSGVGSGPFGQGMAAMTTNVAHHDSHSASTRDDFLIPNLTSEMGLKHKNTHTQLSSAENQSLPVPGLGQKLMKSVNHSILGTPPYYQQPRPPQPPPPRADVSHFQQSSLPPSPPTQVQQSFAYDHVSLKNMPNHFFAHGPLDRPKHQIPSSSLASETPSSMHPPLSAGSAVQGQAQRISTDAEPNESLQMMQQGLPTETARKGETDEDSKKFQATLELAAALLKQLQQQTKS